MSVTKQRALAIQSPRGPLELITKVIPHPGPADILVKIHSIGLNPVEWKIQTEDLDIDAFGVSYPLLMGTDGAGTIIDLGKDVKGFEKGDRILFQGWLSEDRSSYQEYALVYADLTAKVPSSITFLEAASVPVCLATAALGLSLPYQPKARGGAGLVPFWDEKARNFYRTHPIVILGGSSATGQFAIQIVKYLGFSPIIVTASSRNTEYLKSLGATHVVNRFSSDIKSGIYTILQNECPELPLQVVFDTVHTPITQDQVDLLPPGGLLASTWELPKDLKLTENRKVVAYNGSAHFYKEEGRRMFGCLERFLEEGIIKPLQVEKLDGGLGGIPSGLDRLQKQGGSSIKLVVDPTETQFKASK